MFIKQIIIQGFKSYKDQTVIEPFSSRHNVIVGRNGSGKSNFFWAVRFVLNDAYSVMSREERQSLLHEGSGPAAMSAFVEVIFDNADHRFPTGRDEVVLRRTIGLKKDEFALDKKSATKTEVMNFLESAGFSAANPYYIVPQGRITALCNAKDTDRLMLLKEVAGTGVYETRRTESLKIMADTDLKRQKIDELMQFIDDRLAELEEEKAELTEFTRLDKDRRCIEHAIYDRELRQVTGELDALEGSRQAQVHESHTASEAARATDADLDAAVRLLQDLERQLDLLRIDRDARDLVHAQRVQKVTELELALRDAEQGQTAERVATLEAELVTTRAETDSTRAEIHALEPHVQDLTLQERTLQRDHEDKESRRRVLLGKQGRAGQFASAQDRQAWMTHEMDQLAQVLARERREAAEMQHELATIDAQVVEAERDAAKLQAQSEAAQASSRQLREALMKANERRDKLADDRKDLWRQESRADSTLENIKDQLSALERTLYSSVDRSTSNGLQTVRDIVARLQLTGYHGALYELMDVPEEYRTAVEVIGGTSIFHVVVEDDAVASRILDEMKHVRSAGRVTLMPLNRLRPKDSAYPDSSNAIAMLDQIQFDPKFRPAFQQVYGKAIICPDLPTAAQFSKASSLDAVTIAGDRVDRKGALSGGYLDTRKSRLEAALQYKAVKAQLQQAERDAQAIKQKIRATDQQVTQAVARVQELQLQQQHAHDESAMADWQATKKTQARLATTRADLQAQLHRLEQDIHDHDAKLAGLRDEMQAASSALSDEERQELVHLEREISENRRQWQRVSQALSERKRQLESLQVKLDHNLILRAIGLQQDLVAAQEAALVNQADQVQRDLARAREQVAAAHRELQQVGQQIDAATTQITKAQQRIDALKQALAERRRTIDEQELALSRLLQQRRMFLERRAEVQRNIRELGVVPEGFRRYEDTDLATLVRTLKRTNDQLKQFAHVNKKAFEQYTNFATQKEQLEARKSELDESDQSIRNLIATLDHRKDEAIRRTFQQVAKNFERVFEELAPAGRGRLIIVRDSAPAGAGNSGNGDDDGMDVDASDLDEEDQVATYRGISIQVSFNSKVDEGLKMQQLSGGQKSLVALALIFAIQQCDPAPFYLFDEIDANLDAQYRTAVANLLHRLSDHAQFITTTFRPELLVHADKFYGVTFHNKASKIQAIAKEEAVGFIELGAQETVVAAAAAAPQEEVVEPAVEATLEPEVELMER
ncbi:hypothetical protein AMAG_01859 [Allomyces macrogynus ATCC 38327]|uniref:Structural maintenance of chromosomes protein n=2 Tax=Allomyces macrogynus (strain ATCC 38327) TaxID=578462 RepID=A0A0L0S0W3_ALLM3|nr:hypothetical protein AMAG_01859 [Allomyces macrogynus ATCC 38327]|eukprot:KNE56016.1 hypothetical protein AMAG_01859 [Allomyces macrogynus ATCC 38327]